jgi:putative ABC transport system ATP-binding protein
VASVVEAAALHRTYGSGIDAVRALIDVSVVIEPGEFVAIEGPSGCGKSTLLHLLGGLDVPDEGHVSFGAVRLSALDDTGRSVFRRDRVGMVLPVIELIPTLRLWENVASSLLLSGTRLSTGRTRAQGLLDAVGLGHRAEAFSGRLSTGEAQRTSLARALFNEPQLLLADEPTSYLDSVRGDEVLRLLRDLADRGQSIVMATHDSRAAAFADRSVRLFDGRVVDDGVPSG